MKRILIFFLIAIILKSKKKARNSPHGSITVVNGKWNWNDGFQNGKSEAGP